MEQRRAFVRRHTGRWSAFAADGAVLCIAMVWGASYPVAKTALFFVPVLALISLRFAITAAVMSCLNWREIVGVKASDFAASLALGTILFAIFVAETFGVSRTSATNAAFIISLCTVMTPLLDYGLARRGPPLRVVGAAMLSCAGVAVLCKQLTALSAGDGLVLVAAGLRAVLVVSTKRLMRNRHLSSGALTAVQSSTVFALACVFAAVTGVKVDRSVLMQVPFVEALLFLSILCTIAAFYIQNLAVRRSSPTKVSFLMSTEPVFGLIFASIVLAEPISARALAGGGMILSGTIIGILGDMGTRRRTSQTVDGSAGPLTT